MNQGSQKQEIGSLQLSKSYESLYLQMWQRLLNIALTQFIKTFLMTFIIIAIVDRLITRHLRDLEQQVKRLTPQNKPQNITVKRRHSDDNPDEIDQVVEALNRLLQENYETLNQLQIAHGERLVAADELMEAQQGVAMQQLATGIIHDLNNLLSIVSGTLLVLRSQWEDQEGVLDAALYANFNRHFTKMESATEGAIRVARLQLDSAKGKITSERLNLLETIKSVLLMQERALNRTKVRVKLNIDPKIMIWMPKGIILTILINLMKNAMEAFDVMPEFHPSLITLQATETSDGDVLLSLTDNGPGLSEEVKGRMFAYGFTTKKTGHGFGLHFCKSLLESCRGTIEVSSQGAGLGTTFTLRLPSSAQEDEVTVAQAS